MWKRERDREGYCLNRLDNSISLSNDAKHPSKGLIFFLEGPLAEPCVTPQARPELAPEIEVKKSMQLL